MTAIDALTNGVWEWLINNAQECMQAIGEDIETFEFDQILADWVEDAMREFCPDDMNAFVLAACRLADWNQLATMITEEWATWE